MDPTERGRGSSRKLHQEERRKGMKSLFLTFAMIAAATLFASAAVAGDLVNVAGASGIALNGQNTK